MSADNLDRRGFFRNVVTGSAAIAAASVAAEVPADAEPTMERRSMPEIMADLAHSAAIMADMAHSAAWIVDNRLRIGACRVDLARTLASVGDTVNFPLVIPGSKRLGNLQVKLDKHVESSFGFPKNEDWLTIRPDLLEPACISIADAINRDAKGSKLICFRERPILFSATLGVIVCTERVILRAVCWYDYNSLKNMFSLDTLYGVA